MIRFKKNHPSAKRPVKAHPTDFGYDVMAVDITWINPYLVKYDTGIAFEGRPGMACFIVPRSSINRTKLTLANSVGLIDPDYRGNLYFYFRRHIGTLQAKLEQLFPKYAAKNRAWDSYIVGDKIGQIVFVQFVNAGEFMEAVDFNLETARGTGGYGSTGR